MEGTDPARKSEGAYVNRERRIAIVHLALISALAASALAQTRNPEILRASSVPDEVKYKTGYVNPVPHPPDFKSALLWGIAIADTRVPGYASAQVEIASTQLICRVDGKDVILNDDQADVRGGLYRRNPWFGTDQHDPIPMTHNLTTQTVVLPVGQRPDRVWHFWSPSPRATLPSGHVAGCTVTVRAKISPGALLQVGMDYWRNPTIAYGPGGNNHEAGASDWYFPSNQWQEATFTDLGGPQF
jgi:hypothetical protein